MMMAKSNAEVRVVAADAPEDATGSVMRSGGFMLTKFCLPNLVIR